MLVWRYIPTIVWLVACFQHVLRVVVVLKQPSLIIHTSRELLQQSVPFYKDSSRAFTRELTRSSIEILAVNADDRGLAIARRTFSSLTAVFPEARRTERAGLLVRTKFLERELYFC